MIQQIYTNYPPRRGPQPLIFPPTMKYATGFAGGDPCDEATGGCSRGICREPNGSIIPVPGSPSYCPTRHDSRLPIPSCPVRPVE